MPEISIIVPVYNAEKYIARCLDALIQQTFKDIEIICIDDGSPDNCPQILDDYANKDNRIRVIHQQNAGAGPARNKGLDAAAGKYIMFCDSDDWYEPNMCEFMRDTLIQQKADVVTCNAFIDEIDRSLPTGTGGYGTVPGGRYTKLTPFYFLSIVGSACLLICRRDILSKFHIRFGTMAMNEDYVFTRELLLVSDAYVISNRWLYHYQLHTGSLVDQWTKKNSQKTDFGFIAPYQKIYNFLADNNLFEKYRRLFTFCYIAFLRSAWRNVNKDNRTEFLKTVHNFISTIPIDNWGGFASNRLMKSIKQQNYPQAIGRMNRWPFFCPKICFIFAYLIIYRKFFARKG